MTRDWLFVRLHTPHDPAALLPSVMPGLLDRLRAADPAARWSFQRLDGAAGLWLHARPDVLSDLTELLRETTTRQHIPLDVDRTPHPTHRESDLAAALADAASDLALAVHAGGGLDPATRLLAAVHHLDHLT